MTTNPVLFIPRATSKSKEEGKEAPSIKNPNESRCDQWVSSNRLRGHCAEKCSDLAMTLSIDSYGFSPLPLKIISYNHFIRPSQFHWLSLTRSTQLQTVLPVSHHIWKRHVRFLAAVESWMFSMSEEVTGISHGSPPPKKNPADLSPPSACMKHTTELCLSTEETSNTGEELLW